VIGSRDAGHAVSCHTGSRRRFGFFREGQKFLRVVEHTASRFRQNQFPGKAAALDQRRAEFSLECLNLLRDCRLRVAEFRSSTVKVLQPDYGTKRFQLP